MEFKYPREPQETNAAWTQHLGEMLKDYYRLAVLPPSVSERWCVQLVTTRLRRYLGSTGESYGVRMAAQPGQIPRLEPASARALPATARTILGGYADLAEPVVARCVDAQPVGRDLHLLAHVVEPSL